MMESMVCCVVFEGKIRSMQNLSFVPQDKPVEDVQTRIKNVEYAQKKKPCRRSHPRRGGLGKGPVKEDG